MPGKVERYIYLTLIYSSVILIIATGPLLSVKIYLVFPEIASVWLVLWVVWTNKIGNFDLTLKPGNKKRLVAKGPYKLVRHPLYTALLMLTLTLVIGYADTLRIFFWLVQLAATVLKIRTDEVLLSKYYGDFSLYRQRTYKLIPFIF